LKNQGRAVGRPVGFCVLAGVDRQLAHVGEVCLARVVERALARDRQGEQGAERGAR
jgi:hypothetical protein